MDATQPAWTGATAGCPPPAAAITYCLVELGSALELFRMNAVTSDIFALSYRRPRRPGGACWASLQDNEAADSLARTADLAQADVPLCMGGLRGYLRAWLAERSEAAFLAGPTGHRALTGAFGQHLDVSGPRGDAIALRRFRIGCLHQVQVGQGRHGRSSTEDPPNFIDSGARNKPNQHICPPQVVGFGRLPSAFDIALVAAWDCNGGHW